ncbi:MAG: ABC transporter substrate-binding protein [Mobilitalea sp.]
MKKKAGIVFAAITIIIVIAATIFIYMNKAYLTQVAFSFQEVVSKTQKDKREHIGDNINRKIKIGVVGSKELMEMTGFLNGIQMAEEEINESGGLLGMDFEITIFDDGDEITSSLEKAQEISNDKDYFAVIGHWSSTTTFPAAQIYDFNGVILVCPNATLTEITHSGYQGVFRNVVNDKVKGEKMADYALKNEWQNVALYYDGKSYGSELTKIFERYGTKIGLNIIDRHGPFNNKKDFLKTYNEWELMGVNSVFIGGRITENTEIIHWIKEKNPDMVLMGGDGFDYTDFIQKEMEKQDIENIFFASMGRPVENDSKYRTFLETYVDKYKTVPTSRSILGYDSVYLLKTAVEEAASLRPSKLIGALKSLTELESLNGSVQFDSYGDLVDQSIVIKQVKNGQIVNQTVGK